MNQETSDYINKMMDRIRVDILYWVHETEHPEMAVTAYLTEALAIAKEYELSYDKLKESMDEVWRRFDE